MNRILGPTSFLACALLILCLGGESLVRAQVVIGEDGTGGETAPVIDPSFDRWLTESKSPTARELSARFSAAAGAPADTSEALLTELSAALVTDPLPRTPNARAERIRKVFFGEDGFRSSTDLADLDNLLPSRIASRRTGYCIGLTLILLDLCERVEWPAVAISVPRHTFLRLLGPKPVNVEATQGGIVRNDDWYTDRFSVGDRPSVLRPLSTKELGGHLLNNVAFARLAGGDIAGARRLVERSLALDPEGVEALTNLGVCQARLGAYEAALEAFSKTLEHWPGDPSTRLNRVNALLPLGRRSEGIGELVSLLEDHPALTSLTARAREIRDQLDLFHDWEDRQRVTHALISQEATRRGVLPGIIGTYHGGTDLRDPRVTRVDPSIEFQWRQSSPARTIPRNHFSVAWRGWLRLPHDAKYSFMVMCSDGVRIRIDGRPVIDAWRTTGDNFPTADVDLRAGYHEFEVDYYEAIDSAGILLMLYSDEQKDRYDLAELLRYPGPEPTAEGTATPSRSDEGTRP